MFLIKLMGGLGNQMFIYAFAKAAQKMGYPTAFIAQDYINPRYFDHFHNELMRNFTLNSPLSKRNQTLKERILATPNSYFIHIRRGDYLISPSFIELGSAYYENTLLELKAHILTTYCFIFSNDILQVREHFIQSLSDRARQGITSECVERNDEEDVIEEMEFMKSAQNAIIANSTFEGADSMAQNRSSWGFLDITLYNAILEKYAKGRGRLKCLTHIPRSRFQVLRLEMGIISLFMDTNLSIKR